LTYNFASIYSRDMLNYTFYRAFRTNTAKLPRTLVSRIHCPSRNDPLPSLSPRRSRETCIGSQSHPIARFSTHHQTSRTPVQPSKTPKPLQYLNLSQVHLRLNHFNSQPTITISAKYDLRISQKTQLAKVQIYMVRPLGA
jgi:hypothetical protein